MIKTKELSDPNSCLNKARDDELLFVLLGRDVAAIAAVEAWIVERVALGKNKHIDGQVIEAVNWIAQCKEYQRELLARELCEHEWVWSMNPEVVKGSWCHKCGVPKPLKE